MNDGDPYKEICFAEWREFDRRAFSEWAMDFIILPAGGFAISGNFHIEKSRQLIEPFAALQDDSIRQVTVAAAIQGGKSLLSDAWIPRTLATSPGPILLAMQTQRIAEEHAETRLFPIVEECDPIKSIIPNSKSKRRRDLIIFKNRVPLYIRGPALGGAQSKSIRFLSLDECWLLAMQHPGRIGEFKARTSKYDEIGNSKQLLTSQGSEVIYDPEGKIVGDDFALEWFDGTQEFWSIKCTVCGHAFVPKWTIDLPEEKFAGMRWDANGGQVRYECPAHGCKMTDSDATKAAWNDGGFYTVTNPGAIAHRSFTWPAWISGKWEPLVRQYLQSMQSKKSGLLIPLREFIQKKCGEFWNTKIQSGINETEIWTEDYRVKPITQGEVVWADGKFRFMTVDCQANLLLFFIVIREWAMSGESRRIFRGQVDSWASVVDIQKEFGVPSKFVIVDIGYEQSKVFRECCRHVEANGRGWTAFKESDRESFPHHFKDKPVENRIYSEMTTGDPALGLKNPDVLKWLVGVSAHAAKFYNEGKLKCPTYQFSHGAANDILQGFIDGKMLSKWLAPDSEKNDNDEVIYRLHLGSNVKRAFRNAKTNREEMKWCSLGPDHYRACERMQIPAAAMAGCLNLSPK